MRLSTPARRITAIAAALACATTLTVGTVGAQAESKPKPTQQSQKFRKAVTVKGINQHLDAFAGIAEANGGTRASGTPGYAASRDYVVKRLRNAGYRPTVQSFDFIFSAELSPTLLQRTAPSAKDYVAGEDFLIAEYAGSGDVTAPVVPVDTDLTPSTTSTSGCEAADFAGFPAGAIALMQRGTCPFAQKATNALAAGAGAAIIFNRGVDLDGDPGSTVINATLGAPVDLPVLGASFAAGQELGAAGTSARVRTDTITEERETWNVVAETGRGNPSNVVMAGAHLDSVFAGPGINDNASGSATILEVAEELAKTKRIPNKVRFAWWGAEESGLLGAYDYVEGLVNNNPEALSDIATYLNFDMVGSPNFVRFVYDGDNSTGQGAEGPEGSAQVEQLFLDYFKSRKLATDPTAFDGRSDYGPFIENGISAGGLFTGAEEIKTARQARIYGGTAGQAFDPCYHQACDGRSNISTQAIDQMSDAVAHAVWTLSRSTRLLDGAAARTAADHRTMRGQATPGAPDALTR